MPWKNGGGTTAEITAHPAGAAIDAFDWRASVADVGTSGPFSRFPGIDRTIVLLAGAGMELAGGHGGVALTVPFEPYAFSGDDDVACTLVAGPVRDSTLMVRRDRARGRLVVVRDAGARIAPARYRLCYVAAGAAECLLAGQPPRDLARDHALLDAEPGGAGAAPMQVNPLTPDAVVLVATIDPIP